MSLDLDGFYPLYPLSFSELGEVSQPTISPLSEKPTASPLSEKDQIASEIASKIAANAAHRRSLEGVTPSTETAPAFAAPAKMIG